MRPSDDEADLPETGWWAQLLNWSLQPRILGTVVLAGLFVVIIPAIPTLWPSVSQRAKFKMSTDRIDITTSARHDLPATGQATHRVTTRWKPHEIVQQVAQRYPKWKDRSLLDAGLVAELAQAFAQHPWIASVDRVEKTRQGRIIIQVTYRTPAAVVETHRGLSVVDAEGDLLPNDLLTKDYDQLPHLRGIQSIPNGPPGTPWGDPMVVAGAKLCHALMPQGTIDSHWSRYGLDAVIAPIPNRDTVEIRPEPPVFELRTQLGRRIVWGHSPGEDSLEPTVRQKLDRLDEYIRQKSSLELPSGTYIELRDFTSIHVYAEERNDREVIR